MKMGDHAKADQMAKREQFIAETKQFIDKECAEIGEVLSHMSWTPDHILKNGSVTQCPHDGGHQIPESSFKQHAAVCQLRKMGLSAQELEHHLQNDDIIFKKSELVGKVKLDEALLNRILWNHSMENREVHMGYRTMPLSADDWWVKLSAQDRLAVYEYCVQILKAEGKMANVERDEVLTTDWEKIVKKGLLEQGEKPTSEMELLAMLRDQKRRRQSYRAKNVHITKKSYTEIIREVIQNQMEIMMPSGEITEEQKDADTAQEKQDNDDHRHHHDRSLSQTKSRSPRRQRNRSRSPGRWKYHNNRERRGSRSPKRRRHFNSQSPRRSRSRTRSRSPRERGYGTGRSRQEEASTSSSRTQGTEDEKVLSSDRSTRQDEEFEEGQIKSDDSSSQYKRSHFKKKSSKHKKHKHKKHKSKSFHSDSD